MKLVAGLIGDPVPYWSIVPSGISRTLAALLLLFDEVRRSAYAVQLSSGACGVTALDAADCEPVPLVLIAATLNVYVVPLTRPVTVLLVAAEPTRTGVPAVAPT